jgi:hypothetical protein
MVDREELRAQFVDAFEGAEYPVSGPMELLPALPDGPRTRFESGELSVTAVDLYRSGDGEGSFPYDSVEALADDLMTGLEREGHLE